MEGQPVPTSLFFSTTFSVPRLGVFIRYLSFASFKCRPDVRELMQRGMRETTLMIREFSSRHDRPPPSFFFQRAPAHMRVCVCGLSAMRPNVQLCDTLRQRLPPLMLTFVNRVFFVQWIRVQRVFRRDAALVKDIIYRITIYVYRMMTRVDFWRIERKTYDVTQDLEAAKRGTEFIIDYNLKSFSCQVDSLGKRS